MELACLALVLVGGRPLLAAPPQAAVGDRVVFNKEQPRMRWLDSITHSVGMNLSKLGEMGEDRGAWCASE